MTFYTDRVAMMKAISPENPIGIEIGVQRGEFSAQLLDALKPARLHLIDAWEEQDGFFYDDPANISQGGQDALYRLVCERFAARSEVVIHRGYSPNELYKFSDYSMDFCFVDANHSYRAALLDLLSVERLIKPGGFIAGHDFTSHWEAIERGYRVPEAVQAFLHDGRWEMFAMTQERWASFALRRTK